MYALATGMVDIVQCYSLRDGSAVEIVGLCASTLRWLTSLSADHVYPYTGVTVTNQGEWQNVTYIAVCLLMSVSFSFVKLAYT